MPELPDVETFRRYVDATSLGRRIADVMLREALVEDVSPQTIRRRLRGSTFDRTRRHGKHLFIDAGKGWLRLHFGMSGWLEASASADTPEHTEIRVDFTDGLHLAYVNVRRFGAISWVDDIGGFVVERGLGPDAFGGDLGRADFHRRLGSRRGTIKGALMNQAVVSGLGNVYVDEILFHAGVHPESRPGSLDPGRLDDVYDAMREVLDVAVDRQADVERLPASWLLPRRETGSPCPRDDGTIERIEVIGRPTYVCRRHQPRPG